MQSFFETFQCCNEWRKFKRVRYTGCIKKSRQFRNVSQPCEAASSMKFFVNRDCLGTCDVE